jgi:hypothetical protein
MSSVAAVARAVEPRQDWEDEDSIDEPWTPLLLVGAANGRKSGAGEGPTRASPRPSETSDLRAQFDLLADELLLDGAGVSVPRRLAGHPAYVGILSLGEQAIPLLVERLASAGGRPIWLTLLGSLTGFQPGAGKETVREAAAEWIRWGKRGGHLA